MLIVKWMFAVSQSTGIDRSLSDPETKRLKPISITEIVWTLLLIIQKYYLKLSISSINVGTTISGGQLMRRVKIKLLTDAK